MNSNKNYRVVQLVSIVFMLYVLWSGATLFFGYTHETLHKINLLSDVFLEGKTKTHTGEIVATETPTAPTTEYDFRIYEKGGIITNFSSDEQCALPKFATKIDSLEKTEQGKIRIAYFGDSMIEGDLLTATLRALLQKEFGGHGVGFLPMHSTVGKFRQTATANTSGWVDTSFKDKNTNKLYLSGHRFTGSGKGIYTDQTISNDSSLVMKYLLFGNANSSITFNNKVISIVGNKSVNKLILAEDFSRKINLQSHDATTPMYGVSFESKNGIILDNFSFRGITGVELKKIDEQILQDIDTENHYDLIILQYGVNLLFRPKDTDYSYYKKNFAPVLQKLKKNFPNSEFLLISTADRAFKYNGEYQSAIGIQELVKTQAELAFENKIAFYNQWQSMGGKNSIKRWANEKPPRANKDYIHPNHKGSEELANLLFSAIMKMIHSKNNQSKIIKK